MYSGLVEISKLLEDDMVTGAELTAALTTVTRAMDGLKKIKELADKTNDLETKELIIEMRSQLADTKSVLIDAKEEINVLKEENSKLRQTISQKESMTFRDDAYFKDGDPVPFCSSCFDSEGKEIHLKPTLPQLYIMGKFQCPACKNYSQPQ